MLWRADGNGIAIRCIEQYFSHPYRVIVYMPASTSKSRDLRVVTMGGGG